MALLSGGGYAEYAVASQSMVLPVPQGYTFVSAAAIPESFLTAWQLLRFVGDVQEGQRVLLHAGASCLGVAASQLTEKYFRATAVTTSSAAKVEYCKRYASVCLSRTPDESGLLFANKVRTLLGEESINCIVEPIFGGNYMQENEAVLAERGRIIVVAYMGGARVQLNLMPLYRLRAHLLFSKLRCRSDAYRAQVVSTFEEEILPYLHERIIVPAMFKSLPLREAAQAHQLLESSTNWGKIVLTTGAHSAGEI
ncbi:NADPH2:quinone reductase [Strigomonas culicis]|uniref:NADPH2:quinone reductase n=1 Tax=Strigomonas culicis TaxID=28005 RepID=S9UJ85_9TRYP|nr:NADPH2:quinone reductase [Strigomonas culicis]|eukprot:EPY28819.1 NADPH2:quinone reductase [Strigomonas culicis]